jgi:hypothetical protein
MSDMNAANHRIFVWSNWVLPIFGDADADLIERPCSVCFTEGLPGEADRKAEKFSEEAASDNEVSGSVKFEKEWFAPRKSLEFELRRRPPKVHFIHD